MAVEKVSGEITVDGKPEDSVSVRCIPLGEFEPKDLSNALGGTTTAEGKFTLGTYESADGVPPGEYALTFIWPKFNGRKQSRRDQQKNDRLSGKYGTVENSPMKIKVEKGVPLKLDLIELKTK